MERSETLGILIIMMNPERVALICFLKKSMLFGASTVIKENDTTLAFIRNLKLRNEVAPLGIAPTVARFL